MEVWSVFCMKSRKRLMKGFSMSTLPLSHHTGSHSTWMDHLSNRSIADSHHQIILALVHFELSRIISHRRPSRKIIYILWCWQAYHSQAATGINYLQSSPLLPPTPVAMDSPMLYRVIHSQMVPKEDVCPVQLKSIIFPVVTQIGQIIVSLVMWIVLRDL